MFGKGEHSSIMRNSSTRTDCINTADTIELARHAQSVDRLLKTRTYSQRLSMQGTQPTSQVTWSGMIDPLSGSEGGARLGIEGTASEKAVYLDPNLQIAFCVALMAVLRVRSVAPAFPDIGRAFHVSSDSMSLLTTAFALPSVFLTPILGILADHWGRKRVLFPSLMLFGLAGGACALARDFELLLALRFLHGIGAASLSMLNITLAADLYEGRVRTTAMRYNAIVRGVGAALFPLLGGVLAALGWYYLFTLALLAIPIALLVLLGLRNPEPSGSQALGAYLGYALRSLRSWQVMGFFTARFVVFVTMFGCYLTYYPFLLEDRFSASPVVVGLLGQTFGPLLMGGVFSLWGMEAEEISSIIGRGKRVVLEYAELARQYHPELFVEPD
jgi:MFS family permease